MNPADIINNNTNKLDDSNKKLNSIEKIAIETEDLSLSAINKIKEQGETIDKNHNIIIDTGYDIGDSTKHLRDIEKESKKFKMILFYIIILLAVLIVIVYKIKN